MEELGFPDEGDELVMPSFSKKGLQHMIDRAKLRHDLAQHEEDFMETSMCFGEILAMTQLAECYGWHVVGGVILREEGDDE